MSNPLKLLRDLFPQAPLLIGTVQSVSGGVATISVQGSGSMQARGSATVGTKVFFRDGAIEGVAPDLVVESIEI